MIGAWLLILSTVIYSLAACAFCFERQYGLAVMYIGYSLANFGVIWIALGHR